MSASLAQIYPSQGLNYYVRDNYYTADKAVGNSEWFGRGAKALGLSGAVDAIKFQHLLDGYNPEGTESLTGLINKTYGHTEKGKQIRHRAGMDITFSPPKSVSIAAYLGGVSEAEMAHKAAVDETLGMLEKNHSVVREGERGNRRKSVTGNLIVAKFLHDTSREKDPQMHTHCIIVSASKRKDGKWRRLTTETFFNNSAFINQYYLNSLAKELKNRGIGIEKTEHAFEIAGYTREQIVEFSKRTEKIEKLNSPNKRKERVDKLRARPAKGEDVERDQLLPGWQRRSEKLAVVHPGFKSRIPTESDRKIAAAQTNTAKYRRQEHVLSDRVVDAAQRVSASTGRKTRQNIAAEMMRNDPGLFPSATMFERAKNARELITNKNGEVVLRNAFASKDDFLKPDSSERPVPLTPSLNDIYKNKAPIGSDLSDLRNPKRLGEKPESKSSARFASKLAFDLASTYLPFAHDARDAYETVVGKDLVTGRKLSSAERLTTLGELDAGSVRVNSNSVKFAARTFREVRESSRQKDQKRPQYVRSDSELEKGTFKYGDKRKENDISAKTPVEVKQEPRKFTPTVAVPRDVEKIKNYQNFDPESAKWAEALRQARLEQREKAEGLPIGSLEKEASKESGLKAPPQPPLDPESAKWAEALRQAKLEQHRKGSEIYPEKPKTSDEIFWKAVQVEGYNRAAFQDELAKEKVTESKKEVERKKAK